MTSTVLILLLVSWCAFLDTEGAPYPPNASFYEGQGISDGKIINGQNAAEGQFPHQVAMTLNGGFHCGGSIISDRYILTAAHCVNIAGTLSVRVGSIYWENGGQTHGVKRTVMHPQYNPQSKHNDIALVELTTPVVQSATVKIIPLESNQAQVGQEMKTSGWGQIDPHNPHAIPPNLKFISTTINNDRLAWEPFAGIVGTYAGDGKGICKGDSGGPLTTPQGTLVGVTSFVQLPCAGTGKADAFANVPHYVSWIRQNMQ